MKVKVRIGLGDRPTSLQVRLSSDGLSVESTSILGYPLNNDNRIVFFWGWNFDRPTSRLPLPEEKMICDSRNVRRTAHRKEELMYYLFPHRRRRAHRYPTTPTYCVESHPRLPAVPRNETDFHGSRRVSL